MYRAWGVLASAIVAVALEVGIKLVADSVAVPRNYFIPIGAFVFLVGLQVSLTLRGQRAPRHRGERADVRLNDGRHTIKGDWHGPSAFTVWAIVMVGAVSMLLGGISGVRKAPVGLLIATLCFVTVLAGLCAWVALGSRVHLQFSAAGVAVWRGLGRRRRLRWDEATNFRVSRGEFVAKPVPGSTWYRQGWDRIDPDGVLYLCNLDGAGIKAAAVTAAIDYWTRFRRPRG